MSKIFIHVYRILKRKHQKILINVTTGIIVYMISVLLAKAYRRDLKQKKINEISVFFTELCIFNEGHKPSFLLFHKQIYIFKYL